MLDFILNKASQGSPRRAAQYLMAMFARLGTRPLAVVRGRTVNCDVGVRLSVQLAAYAELAHLEINPHSPLDAADLRKLRSKWPVKATKGKTVAATLLLDWRASLRYGGPMAGLTLPEVFKAAPARLQGLPAWAITLRPIAASKAELRELDVVLTKFIKELS